MEHPLQLAYLGVEVAVRGAPTTEGDATWRNDVRAQRLVVRRGTADDDAYLGAEAPDAAAFAWGHQPLARA